MGVSILGNDIGSYCLREFKRTGTFAQYDLDAYFGFLMPLAREGMQAYVEYLTGLNKPKKVIICMLYDLSEHKSMSWADAWLRTGGVDGDPSDPLLKVRAKSIRRVLFKYGTQHVR